jgi:hypothetical protein
MAEKTTNETTVEVELSYGTGTAGEGVTLAHAPFGLADGEILTPQQIATKYGFDQWLDVIPSGGTVWFFKSADSMADWNAVWDLYYGQCGLIWDPDIQAIELEEDGSTKKTGTLKARVHIYHEVYRTDYTLHASYGTLGEVEQDFEEEITEIKDVEGALSFTVARLINEVVSLEWEGKVFLQDGQTLDPKPDLSADTDMSGKTVTIDNSEVVIGSVKIVYKTLRDECDLEIEPRENIITKTRWGFSLTEGTYEEEYTVNEPFWQSTVRAFWGTGATKLNVDPPDDMSRCSAGYSVSVTGPPEPDRQMYVTFKVYDYCTGEDITAQSQIFVDGRTMSVEEANLLDLGDHDMVVKANGYIDSSADQIANDSFKLELPEDND